MRTEAPRGENKRQRETSGYPSAARRKAHRVAMKQQPDEADLESGGPSKKHESGEVGTKHNMSNFRRDRWDENARATNSACKIEESWRAMESTRARLEGR